ncbi:MAG: AI-2E family transporter [Coleofasciculaceae cyanobacterium SM2_1_6]|nr:AI-2E family transporter [Coleofasciculaceae cyanobacterium SM2_1_6]
MNRLISPLQQFFLTWILVLITGWLTLNLLGYLGELISIFLTAGLGAFLLNFLVSKMQKVLPRSLAALLVYLLVGVGLLIVVLTLVPPVFNQGKQLITNLPDLLESAQMQLIEFQNWSIQRNLPFDVNILVSQLLAKVQERAEGIASKGFGLVLGTFNWFLDLILILVISFYMLLDGDRLWQGIVSIFTPKIRDGLTESLQRNLRGFVAGQLLLGLFMAVSLSFAFFLLRVPFFLLFAVFIGLMEIIPFIGASLGIGVVVILVVFIDWWLAVQVLGVAIALQQVKDNLISPRIMGSLTGLSPVIIFAALLLGTKIGGLLGVILAIPLTGVIKSLVEIIFDPTLPPQTGSFFHNPLARETVITNATNSVDDLQTASEDLALSNND